jgi:hypothetical protein
VQADDARVAGAQHARRGDELRIADDERLGPRQPGVDRPGREGDRDHGVLDAGAQRRHEGERQDQPRHRQEDVRRRHEQAVGPAAEIAGDRTQQHPERRRDHGHQQHDGDGDARAVDDAGEDVAAQLVRAHPVGR